MAGSYQTAREGWSLIENMGDAYEAVEEMLFLILSYLDSQEIEDALTYFYQYANGESAPDESDYGIAYIMTQQSMES